MNKMIEMKLSYGKSSLGFNLPEDRLLGVLENKCKGTADIKKLLSASLGAPTVKKSLKRMASGRKKVLVVVPDNTRKAHLGDILPYFLGLLKGFGAEPSVIVATGLHKKHNSRELKALLGAGVFGHYPVLSHELSPKHLFKAGRTKRGVPIVLDKRIKNYDLIMTVGVIEPHLYAGYSGGAKTIGIGLAGEETINATHSIGFLDNPLTRLGSVERNPFQDTLWEIIKDIKIAFAVNVVNNQDGVLLKIFAGGIKDVFKRGAAFSKGVFEVKAGEAAGIVICGVGHPKDHNIYQASRAINYILNVDRPVLKKGGILILACALDGDIGLGVTEKRFYAMMKEISSPIQTVTKIRERGCIAGVHRAYMVAKAAVDYRVVFITPPGKTFMAELPFPHFENIYMAIKYADEVAGDRPKIYVVPNALSTIARSR